MKILHVIGSLNTGGVELWLLGILERQIKYGHEVHFCCLSGEKGIHAEQARLNGGSVIALNLKSNPLSFPKRFRKLLRVGQYDVVHSHVHYFSGVIMFLASNEQVVSRISQSHTADVRSFQNFTRKLYRGLMSLMIGRYATDVLGDSEECTQTFVPESWIRGERATVYCSVNPQKLFAPRTKTEVRKVLGLPTSSLIVGHVGRLAKVKNHEKILAVFREIAFRQPDACMLCVGDGPEQSRLKKFCAEEGLKNVYWVGAQSEVSQYLRAMDVFLFPSHWEGLSIALLEAQLSGLPCVVSAHLTKEAVIEGSTVRFVALKESNQHWASVVIEEAKNNRCDLAAVASRFSRSRFSPETCVQSLSKIYRRLQPPR